MHRPADRLSFAEPLSGAVDGVGRGMYIRAGGYAAPNFDTAMDRVRDRAGWSVHTLGCGHDVMVDMPEALTRISWSKRRHDPTQAALRLERPIGMNRLESRASGWETTRAFLAARAIAGIEVVGPEAYHRAIVVNDKAALLTVWPDGNGLSWETAPELGEDEEIRCRLARLFGLDHETEAAREALSADPDLGPLVTRDHTSASPDAGRRSNSPSEPSSGSKSAWQEPEQWPDGWSQPLAAP